MINNLEKEYHLKGKTEKEILELLGEPDSSWEHDFEDGHYTYYKYFIGRKRELFELMYEPDMYLVTFCDGVVVAMSVQPT